MPKIRFTDIKLRASSLLIVDQANQIIDEYLSMGFRLTLRQLYYQFVSRDWLPNRQKEYKRLGSIINDARLAGLIDWDAIEDRGRNLQSLATWGSPSSIIDACAGQFRLDLWIDQPNYVEVWVEKEALVGVVGVPCDKWRVPYFACKGYTSQSEMWDAGYNRLRTLAAEPNGWNRRQPAKKITVLHLGDHDPSGIDMTRDIRDRLSLFVGRPVEIVRLALNMDQIEEFNPPPNPAKVTDSRFEGYAAEYGDESWELDALRPDTIAGLIEREIEARVDQDLWETASLDEEVAQRQLETIAARFDEIVAWMEYGDGDSGDPVE